MGRTGAAQRQKKAEKAKVKLKGHATKFLPKGKNVTNTTFKVRKIVLQQQLKTPDVSQPLTTRKLNVKEVLSRLQHYSSSQRQEGLVGLNELVSQMDLFQLTSHLSSIMDSLARLALDPEASVRRHSAHILTSVFSLVSETQLMPFCAILGSYLSCAMTHIQLGIQEDSLLLFDALLENAPTVAAATANQLLPCILDMISRTRSDHQSSRQLSIQLSSNLTSAIWRAKVFGRLQALLVVSLEHSRERVPQNEKVLHSTGHISHGISIDSGNDWVYPLYNRFYATPVRLSKIFQKSTKSNKQLLDNADELRKFVESIMPLMFDSWMEVNPLSSKTQKAEDSGLQLEPALTLHCVLEIIDLLWQHLVLWEKENSRHDLTEWFNAKYQKDVSRFLGKGFPYTARVSVVRDADNTSQGSGRRKSKTNKIASPEMFKLASPFFLKDKDEQSCNEGIAQCVLQNLTLCHLLANMQKSPPKDVKEKILEILITYLNKWGGGLFPWSSHLLRALRSIFEKSSNWTCDLNPLLTAVVSRYNLSSIKSSASHQLLASQLCDLLGEVPFLTNFQHLQRCEDFSSWILNLPASLGSRNLTVDKLHLFNKLASQNNAAFLKGLSNAFQDLLHAVCNFTLAEGENKFEKEAGLASLFYWIPQWNDEHVLLLQEVLSKNKSSTLIQKIVSILMFRLEKFQSLANASWLCEYLQKEKK